MTFGDRNDEEYLRMTGQFPYNQSPVSLKFSIQEKPISIPLPQISNNTAITDIEIKYLFIICLAVGLFWVVKR